MRYLIFTGLIFTNVLLLLQATAIEKTPAETVKLEFNGIKDPKLIIDYQLASIDRLLEMTTRTVADLNTLRSLISDYKQKQESYLESPDDKEKLFKMSKAADLVVSQSKSSNLQDVLDPDFLKEVTMLAQIYRKLSLPTVP